MNKDKMIEEQKDLKGKLLELIDYMNSEEFFSLSENEKALLNSQRTGMEMYLNALTNRIYGEESKHDVSGSFFPLLLLGMLSGNMWGSSTPLPTAVPKEAVDEENHKDNADD